MTKTFILIISPFLFSCLEPGRPVAPFSDTVAISFHDNSLNKENTSVSITIDEKTVFQSDSINKLKSQDFELILANGNHVVKVQTLDKRFPIIDTIKIEKENKKYLLSINYAYNPPKEWWDKFVVTETYKMTLIENKLPTDTVIKWLMDSVSREIERASKTSPSYYEPSDRHFDINFHDQPMLE